jgi:glycosyltransferase involved in cell wall biosynthesis
LLKYCPGVDPGKVHVVHHGNRLLANEVSSPLNDGQYLLFVGQRKGYKNFSQMLEQISVVLQETPGLQLFCVGGSPFSSEELENIARLRLQGRVQYKMVESDEALTNIYQHAVCFIFPSQYEGFGLPVIEAMACNCPVVLNQASSLPEVGGDAAVYFNSADAVSLPNAVFRLLRDDALRSSMIEKGRTRAAQFTWKKSAEAHLKIYQSLLA